MAGTKLGRRKGRTAAAPRHVAAYGEEKSCPTKRKASGSGDVPSAGAGEAIPSLADLAMRRERLKSCLLSFPEAAALDDIHMYDAVDRILREYNPSTATPTPQGMVRLDDDSIIAAFNFANWLFTCTTEDEPPAGADPLVWLDERRRTLDEETKRCEPNNSRFVIAKIRVDLLTKGYVELPNAYVECIPVLPAVRDGSPPKNMTAVVA